MRESKNVIFKEFLLNIKKYQTETIKNYEVFISIVVVYDANE